MKKNKVFIACDTTSTSKIKKIIKDTQTNRLKVGYKFGLEFLNSKNGRQYISKLKTRLRSVIIKYPIYQILVRQQ